MNHGKPFDLDRVVLNRPQETPLDVIQGHTDNFNIGFVIDGDLDELVAELSASHVRAQIEQKIRSLNA